MIIVLTTYQDREKAEEAARMLVGKKLAACVNIIKIEKSIYRWKGKIEENPEYLLIIKTKEKLYQRLETAVKANHPYELP